MLHLLLLILTTFSYAENTEKYPKYISNYSVAGELMIIKSEAFLNWRASCRDFKNEHSDKEKVVQYDCGTPSLNETSEGYTYYSSGSKILELVHPEEHEKCNSQFEN